MTNKFAASTAQAKRVKLVVRDGAAVTVGGTGANVAPAGGFWLLVSGFWLLVSGYW
jgi:hypothetical protein